MLRNKHQKLLIYFLKFHHHPNKESGDFNLKLSIQSSTEVILSVFHYFSLSLLNQTHDVVFVLIPT